MNGLNAFLPLVGRLLLALLFIPAGLGKISGFEDTVGYIASAGLPLPTIAAIVAIVVELGGGIAIALGFKVRWAALALGLFTLVASFAFHNFWAMPAEQQFMQQLMFFKNLAVAGGLFVLAGLGAGALSLDARKA